MERGRGWGGGERTRTDHVKQVCYFKILKEFSRRNRVPTTTTSLLQQNHDCHPQDCTAGRKTAGRSTRSRCDESGSYHREAVSYHSCWGQPRCPPPFLRPSPPSPPLTALSAGVSRCPPPFLRPSPPLLLESPCRPFHQGVCVATASGGVPLHFRQYCNTQQPIPEHQSQGNTCHCCNMQQSTFLNSRTRAIHQYTPALQHATVYS